MKLCDFVRPFPLADIEKTCGRGAAWLGGALSGEPVCDEILNTEQGGGALEMVGFVLFQPQALSGG